LRRCGGGGRAAARAPRPQPPPAPDALAASLGVLLRRDVALVPRPGRRGAAVDRPLAAARPVAPHLRAARVRGLLAPARARLGGGPQLAQRCRALHGIDARARYAAPAHVGPAGSAAALRRRARAASPAPPRLPGTFASPA